MYLDITIAHPVKQQAISKGYRNVFFLVHIQLLYFYSSKLYLWNEKKKHQIKVHSHYIMQ